jgi:hypothetical protein
MYFKAKPGYAKVECYVRKLDRILSILLVAVKAQWKSYTAVSDVSS